MRERAHGLLGASSHPLIHTLDALTGLEVKARRQGAPMGSGDPSR